ncbi:MAG: hypothetical protein WD069_02635 [Planctomycetales bacterium]
MNEFIFESVGPHMRAVRSVAVLIAAAATVGCAYEGLDQEIRKTNAEKQQADGGARVADAAQPRNAEGSHDNGGGAPPETSPPAPPFPIELSLGVALPQTLPEGTAVGCSLEYRFVQGGPDPSWRYAVLAQAANGAQSIHEVPLRQRDTLNWFVAWRPGDGPFHARIVGRGPDGTQRQLSDVIELRE